MPPALNQQRHFLQIGKAKFGGLELAKDWMGQGGARDEFHLAAMVQNFKTMALRLVGRQRASLRGDCVRGLPAWSWCLPIWPATSASNKPKTPADSKTNYFSTASILNGLRNQPKLAMTRGRATRRR